MPKKSKRKKPGGSTRMREFGYKCVYVWLDANEQKIMADAARITGKQTATLIREQAVHACAQIVQVEQATT